jgi:hypothetical protein
MDPAVKAAMAFCVLLGGVCAAALFRRERPEEPITPNAEEQCLLRCRTEAAASSLPTTGQNQSAPTNRPRTSTSRRPATVVTPLDRHEPPPSLASDYPEPERAASSRSGVSMADEPRTHRVVDGDTLAALAERYLGSSVRAQDIYEANRDALCNPMLLPIGVELKLPPRSNQASPQGSLVPVSRGH